MWDIKGVHFRLIDNVLMNIFLHVLGYFTGQIPRSVITKMKGMIIFRFLTHDTKSLSKTDVSNYTPIINVWKYPIHNRAPVLSVLYKKNLFITNISFL
jgi:hypothetical protein